MRDYLQKYAENPPSPEERIPLIVTTFVPTLLKGALVTIGISVLSMMLAVSLGIVLAVMRLYGNTWIKKNFYRIYRSISREHPS
ncbi:hypothetical protein [Candidatus Kuenenia stuttgartiensis]|uniref:hypothetical protein n=1 Tax=Kuenenia stuttgartiensis TaxID=174633 RepID=UPI00146DA485|nr:hypothetical protein [Candidatus Kuenenia stuttgartiensis]